MNNIKLLDVPTPDYALWDIAETKNKFRQDYLLIKENLNIYKLQYDEVIYVSALENYIKIHTLQKGYMFLSTLRQFEQTISNHPFLRVHRSFIVNLDCIAIINKDFITLTNEVQVPIGEFYKKDLEDVFMKGKMLKR
jgi:DNA-binding LytR/AlgR family response regulator